MHIFVVYFECLHNFNLYDMKKLFTLIGVLLLWQSVAVAQNYLHIWTGDSTKIVPVAALDSVTFRDAKFYDADFSNVDGLRFSGNVTDYWGDKHSFDVTLAQGEGTTVYIRNLDPYFAQYGYTAENGANILVGELVVAADGNSANITCPPGQTIGYQDCVFVNPLGGETISFTLAEGTLTCETGYGVCTAEGGYYSAFNPFTLNAVSGTRAPALVRKAASHPTLHAPQRLLERTSKQEDKQEAMQPMLCPEDVTID